MFLITLTEFLIFTGSFLSLIAIIRLRNRKRKPGLPYPPSFPSLPLVGSLPFIKDFEALPEYFLKKSYELGPVFSLRFGSRFIVVLNDKKSIEDALVKHSSSFSGRDCLYIEKYHLNPNQNGIGSMNYHDEFKKYQRLTLTVLRDLGFGSRNLMEQRISLEVGELVDYVRTTKGKSFDPKEIIILSVANVMMNILFGTRQKYEDGLHEACLAMKKFTHSLDPALDFFPILRFFPPYSNKFKDLISNSARIMASVDKEMEASLKDIGEDNDNFVRRYVEKEGDNCDLDQLRYTVRDFIAAGTETTATTILWAFILLGNHPHIMEKVQKEIDSVVPRERLPSADDEPKMPYVRATILEVLRHRSVVPLAFPHLTLHDSEILGYFIPANTVIIPNVQAANWNRNDWLESTVFRPERFLDVDNKLINKDHVIAFSLGRRSCLGESMARQQLFLFISGILQIFSIRPPDGLPSISVKAVQGVNQYPSPFDIRLVARNA